MKKNSVTKQFIETKTKIEKHPNKFVFTNGDIEFIKSVQKLKYEIYDSFDKSIKQEIATESSSLVSQYYLTESNVRDTNNILKNIIRFRIYYEKNFYRAKNESGRRNPFLQLFITNMLNSINRLVNNTKLFRDEIEIPIGEQFRGDDKYITLINNINSISVKEKYVCDVLSNIDNIIYFDNLDLESYSGDRFFYVCINTHFDIDDISARDKMLVIEEEIGLLERWFKKYNIRNLITVNPTRDFFLTIMNQFKPKKFHYIGHSEKEFLRFRAQQRITALDIITSYENCSSEFIFLNSCSSYSLAYELQQNCSIQSIGYSSQLKNTTAVKFSEQFYKVVSPHNIGNSKLVFERTVESLIESLGSEIYGYLFYP